mgnify:CR=1 FL=1
MSARQDTYQLMRDLSARGLDMSFEDANTLRRAQLTLRRWGELECGDSDQYASYAIERDEETGKPYRTVYRHDRNGRERYAIPDREAGALRRVAEVCKRYGAHYYHQGDPRGCALYVAPVPLPDNDYNRVGVACCV